MQERITLESVNGGRAETVEHNNKSLLTGICKRPVTGPVAVGESGLDGDTVVDLEHHGGPDQAIYVYRSEDYEWWEQTTGKQFPTGLFGENLTVRGLPLSMRVGDRLLIGEVVLEATAPRIPCGTLAARLGDSGFGMDFRKAARPGVYFRVLNGGELQAGDSVTLVESDAVEVTILELFDFYYSLRHQETNLLRFLESPLASRFRSKVEVKLAAIQSVDD